MLVFFSINCIFSNVFFCYVLSLQNVNLLIDSYGITVLSSFASLQLTNVVYFLQVKDLRQKLAFDRWTSENRQVIPYQYKYDDFTVSLTQHYKEPSSEVVVTQDSIRELNRHNYVHKMHKMLELEEMTRQKLISRLIFPSFD